jgi:hypothetical protein
MSAVRIKVYEDQFEGLRVEIDGRCITPGTTIPAMIDNVDVEGWTREMLANLFRDLDVNVEVTK